MRYVIQKYYFILIKLQQFAKIEHVCIHEKKELRKMLQKVKDLVSDALVYWRKPPKGRYVNYRGVFAYSVGGIGFYCIMYIYMAISVSSSNVIMSNATGLGPEELLAMQYVTFVINLFFTGIRAKMIDSCRSAKGKYRPYILKMGIPTAVISCAMVWCPYTWFNSMAVRWMLAFVLNLALQFFYNFMYEAYENLVLVMSPNSQERADISSVKSIVYSIAPTILNPLIPLMVKWMNTDDMYDVRIYRVLYPPTAIVGILLSILIYVYVEENIVQAKTHVVEIHFIDALRAVAKNKYFWIISLAGWIGFLESTQTYILGWLYNYGKMCTDAQYALITLIYGNASLWGMIAAPLAIRKWGKKKVLIYTNLLNIGFIALMYPSIKVAHSIWLVLVCLYVNALVNSFSMILSPAVNADIRDYQHYISGERIDGMFSAVGIIGSLIGLATGTVLPAIFDSYGINSNNGYENAYDILKYNPDVLYSLIYLLILLSVIGAALNVIPYFFYDLTELKQKGMVRILKIRALFEDYGNGVSRDKDLVEAVDLVRSSRQNAAAEPYILSKDEIKKAKATKDKEKIRAAKKEYRRQKDFNEEIEISRLAVAELNKFSDPVVAAKLERAKQTVNAGKESVFTVSDSILADAKAMPHTTEEEKRIRRDRIEEARVMLRGKKTANKIYPDGKIPEFDISAFKTLFDESDSLDEKLRLAHLEKSVARHGNDTEKAEKIKSDIKALNAKKKENENSLKTVTKDYTFYSRAVKAYTDAEKLVAQEKNYDRFAEIEALYDDAKARSEAKAAEEAAAEAKLEAERKAEKAALKEAKKNKKNMKK